jgi:hypothetical protein
LRWARRREAAGGFERIDRSPKETVNEVAEGEPIDPERLIGLFRLLPAERIAPGKPDRVTKEDLERCGGERPLEDLLQPRMGPADKPVVCGDLRSVPVAPAS